MKDILKSNHVNVVGDGQKTIMLGHGFGCDQNVWRYLVDDLKRDFRIILFDNVGAGQSDLTRYDWEKYSTLQGYADDVIEILDALECDKATFIGHSVGSTIGMLAVIKAPVRFEKLVMIGPSPRYVNDPPYVGGFEPEQMAQLIDWMEKDYQGWAEYIAPLIMANPDRAELGKELIGNFCSVEPEIGKHFGRVTFMNDCRSEVSKVKIPALILQCSEDVVAPLEVGRYLAEHMSVSTLRVLQATGHCPHLSYPEETIQAIRSFV